MAEAVAMRAMFIRLGFSAAAATAIVDTQGIDTLEEVRFLSDDEAEGLCSVVRKPGGTIPNPNADILPDGCGVTEHTWVEL